MLRLVTSLIAFAEQLAVLDVAANMARRLVIYMVVMTMVTLLVLASAACGAASLWIWADGRFGPVEAPLIVAAVLVVLALLLLAGLALQQRAVRQARSARASRAVQDMALAPGRLLQLAAQGFLAGLASRPAPRSDRA
jgi:hypothetical protein